MEILVVGLGLIGGSLCKGISRYTNHTVRGYDTDPAVLDSAVKCGAIASAATTDDFGSFDLVIICLHPHIETAFIKEHISRFQKGAVITDVCGVKGNMVPEITELAAEYGIRFVGAHPMAGKEHYGFAFSDCTIFIGANFIVTPVPQTDKQAVLLVEKLAKELGFGTIVETSPEEHDRIIAYTSQLAHVVSSAYVKSPTMQQEMGFSAGSFKDMTRIATLNESMWTSLFLENRDCLLFELDELIGQLEIYRKAIADSDSKQLKSLLREGRILKEENIRQRTRENE
ncbi:MAG: prephenate dehydrogenase/arogenate dehydrogenase family protein [Ruminococcus sp.]|nr:prephenate dehydrogenase/arogenate dehydrogenase family protein [Ruminococcus sp.]